MQDVSAPIDGRTLPVPPRLANRPRDARGYVVPWFVAQVNGAYDFRIADEAKRRFAVREGLCWLCGERLGKFKAFVIGPMCAVNRTTSEPGCHRECATYAVRVCPFLARPHARRRDAGLPEDAQDAAGIAIPRNPGVAVVWIAQTYSTFPTYATDGPAIVDGWLIRLGDPALVLAYAEGREATADELWESIVTGYPFLAEAARQDVAEASAMLRTHLHAALAELAGFRLLTGSHLARIDRDMPPIGADVGQIAGGFDTAAQVYLGSVDVANPQEG